MFLVNNRTASTSSLYHHNTTQTIPYYQILGTINLVHPQKKPTFLPTLPKPNRVTPFYLIILHYKREPSIDIGFILNEFYAEPNTLNIHLM